MADTAAINLVWTEPSSGKKGNTKISYINASASATDLVDMARKLNALTTNTYVETTRVETSRLDDQFDTE